MITARCSTLSLCYRGPRYPLLSTRCIVIVLAMLVLAVVLALRGYSPQAITGPVLVLVVGTVAAAERLIGVQGARAISTVPAL